MQPRITLITLCVDDLELALRFYRDGLGLKTEGIVGNDFEHGAVALFELQSGLKLALWPKPQARRLLSLPRAPSGVVMQVIFRILISICGRSPGTRSGRRLISR